MSIAEKLTTVAENVPKVYEAGKQAEYDEFWDNFQENGNRTYYPNAFCYGGWNDDNFNPKYPIKPTSCNNMFMSAMYLTDTKVDIDLTGEGTQKYNIFNNAKKLKTVRKLIVNENTPMSGSFDYCTALENVTFEGVIGKNGLDLQWSTKLSKASIESIIYALSTTSNGLAVTLSATALNTAFETSEGAADGSTSEEWTNLISTKSNWTISLV